VSHPDDGLLGLSEEDFAKNAQEAVGGFCERKGLAIIKKTFIFHKMYFLKVLI
jgi:hypothetical protein